MPAALVLFTKFYQEPHPETSMYISLASILLHELPGCKGVQEAFKMKQVTTMNRIRWKPRAGDFSAKPRRVLTNQAELFTLGQDISQTSSLPRGMLELLSA